MKQMSEDVFVILHWHEDCSENVSGKFGFLVRDVYLKEWKNDE